VHRYWRQRHGVGGTDFYTRPKRIGVRASAAMLAEWLKVAWREGWLGSPRRNRNENVVIGASHELANFLLYRTSLGLDKFSDGQLPPKKSKKLKAKAPPPDDGQPPDQSGAPPGFVAGDAIPF
jgi:hypothetical protein